MIRTTRWLVMVLAIGCAGCSSWRSVAWPPGDPAAAPADTLRLQCATRLHLRDGRTLEGTLVRADRDTLAVRTGGLATPEFASDALVTVPRPAVAAAEQDAGEAARGLGWLAIVGLGASLAFAVWFGLSWENGSLD